ncbi:hypothetical protein TREES_T100016003 [Tupaia chinensis]|uniref:Uncharacterized protein n=1 Tax=Tupaia chinensis TaxID=246437 RepID=L9KL51_TUPCH|nr:hypothetical protein TREES_T100016003 [Tupaia chinensis]
MRTSMSVPAILNVQFCKTASTLASRASTGTRDAGPRRGAQQLPFAQPGYWLTSWACSKMKAPAACGERTSTVLDRDDWNRREGKAVSRGGRTLSEHLHPSEIKRPRELIFTTSLQGVSSKQALSPQADKETGAQDIGMLRIHAALQGGSRHARHRGSPPASKEPEALRNLGLQELPKPGFLPSTLPRGSRELLDDSNSVSTITSCEIAGNALRHARLSLNLNEENSSSHTLTVNAAARPVLPVLFMATVGHHTTPSSEGR